MPVVTVFRNGATGGVAAGTARALAAGGSDGAEVDSGLEEAGRPGGARGVVSGWSWASARRQLRWLFGIDAAGLTGAGYALTLTVGSFPASGEEWARARRAWLARVQRRLPLTRFHWVTEFTARGVPHLHLAMYFERPLSEGPDRDEELFLATSWMDVARRRGWRTSVVSQEIHGIDGDLGWLQYISKHASRSVSHYQRMGMPEGWVSSGRLWGHGGAWPEVPPMRLELSMEEFWAVRAAVDELLLREARAAGDEGRIAYLERRRAAGGDDRRAQVLGFSDWVPEVEMLRLLRRVAPRALEPELSVDLAHEAAWVAMSSAPGWTPDFVGSIRERMRARQAADEGIDPDPRIGE